MEAEQIRSKSTEEQLDEMKHKYETAGQKCNSGHVSAYPMSLWDCPDCTDRIVGQLREARQLIVDLTQKPIAPSVFERVKKFLENK